ncbi:hypothetical protein Dsin_001868 [Dipteronia sinensis]|uniref:Uncharacterized protein n=1 Tax=Dipteronia sinensis TaxID=43782 RepID=A0AAE0EJE3_9ROSI|nr:hypothetical protein Dsin_001868 [Dipteronia sinensis]
MTSFEESQVNVSTGSGNNEVEEVELSASGGPKLKRGKSIVWNYMTTLITCLLDWNVDRKLSAITVDNCSTNDCMIEKNKEPMVTFIVVRWNSTYFMLSVALMYKDVFVRAQQHELQ